jgi:hypothetical protein
VWSDFRARKRRAAFPRVCVYPGFQLVLLGRDDTETPVETIGRCWVSQAMIVVPLRLPSGVKQPIVIAREGNDYDAYRRFSILCRFAFAVEDG